MRLQTAAVIGGMILASGAGSYLLVNPEQCATVTALQAYSDLDHRCRYVVGGISDDGFHIRIEGGDHCRNRITVDGRKIAPERRASR